MSRSPLLGAAGRNYLSDYSKEGLHETHGADGLEPSRDAWELVRVIEERNTGVSISAE